MYNAELKRNSDLIKEIQELKMKTNQLPRFIMSVSWENRFTDSKILEIRKYRAEGKTIKEIATMFNCSVGLIHKLISE
ncbi:MAG: hypothetical protein ACLR60_18750 [Clostridium paraputrificum]